MKKKISRLLASLNVISIRKLNNGLKIIITFIFVSILFAIVGFVGVVNINNINKSGDSLYNNNTLGLAYSGDAALAFNQLRFSILRLCVINGEEDRLERLDDIEEHAKSIESWLDQYGKTVITEENQKLYDSLMTTWIRYEGFIDAAVTYSQYNNPEYMAKLIIVDSRELSEDMTYYFDELFELNKNMASHGNQQNQQLGQTATRSMLIFVIAGIIAAIALGVLIGRSISSNVKKVSGQLKRITQGEKIEALDNRKFSGEFINIADNLNALRLSIQKMLDDAADLVNAGIEGKLSMRADASRHMGSYRAIIEGFNRSLDAFIEPIEETVSVLQQLRNGDLGVSIKGEYPGDHAIIKDSLNDTIHTLRDHIGEISYVLKYVAEGDLTKCITSQYHGDFAVLKDSTNSIISSLNILLNDINMAVNEVTVGTQQVSGSSQTISQGTSEQAALIEKLKVSIRQITEQTKKNAQDALKTSGLSAKVEEHAQDGNNKMLVLQDAMVEIEDSSQSISKIIKLINEIALQTNLLALNAAVEAARAGVHGKGFAVVAQEVKKLAAMSTNAVEETIVLIKKSEDSVKIGRNIATQAAGALTNIVESAQEATVLVESIADACGQQATAIMHINTGIEHLSQAVQSNSASTEETAAAAEELTSQAQVMQQMVARFKLNSNVLKNEDEIKDLQDKPANINMEIDIAEPQVAKLAEGTEETTISLNEGDLGE